MPKLKEMPMAFRKKIKNLQVIHPQKDSVVGVAQGDWALMDNDAGGYLYLDTRGAGPCVAIAIRTADKTLVVHMDEDTDARGVGSRDNQNLNDIMPRLLDLVSKDHTQIESIGLVSMAGGLKLDGHGKPRYGKTQADEVFKYLMEKGGLSDDCAIHLGTRKNDLIVQLSNGKMMEMENQVKIQEYANVDHKGDIEGYPADVEHGEILKLVPDPPKNDAAAAPSLDDNDDNNGNDVHGADNEDQQDSDAPPDIDDSNGDGGGDASNDAAASPGGDMASGMDEMNNESEMMEE